jgi:hypothetical protein
MRMTARLFGWNRFGKAAAWILFPAVASATEPQLTIVDHATEMRMVVTLRPVSAGAELVQAGHLPRAGMLYRFRVELLGPAAVSGAGDGWQVGLSVIQSGARVQLAQLGLATPERALPRPLGFQVEAGDSIHVSVQVPTTAEEPLQLRVVIEYEPLDLPVSRLPIIQLTALEAVVDGASPRSWEWTAPVGGRVMVVTGLAVVSTGELVLEDVESGVVIWRETVQPRTGEAFESAPGIVRAGVTVQAGRAYRLTALGAGDTIPVTAGRGEVQAMLLPGRAAGSM